jgi:hypothetical protein
MNYIPYAAWGICYGGTDTEIANYAGSWGLLGDAPDTSGVLDTLFATIGDIIEVAKHCIIYPLSVFWRI